MTLTWKYGENNNQTWEQVTVDNHRITVYDCDGNFSYFEVVQLKPRETVYRSDDFKYKPDSNYHFDIALSAAELWINSNLENK
jgi:hypothetical protein